MPNPFAQLTPEIAKKKAKQLKLLLEKHEINLPLGNALDILARMSGYENWQGMLAGLRRSDQPADAFAKNYHDPLIEESFVPEFKKILSNTGFSLSEWYLDGVAFSQEQKDRLVQVPGFVPREKYGYYISPDDPDLENAPIEWFGNLRMHHGDVWFYNEITLKFPQECGQLAQHLLSWKDLNSDARPRLYYHSDLIAGRYPYSLLFDVEYPAPISDTERFAEIASSLIKNYSLLASWMEALSKDWKSKESVKNLKSHLLLMFNDLEDEDARKEVVRDSNRRSHVDSSTFHRVTIDGVNLYGFANYEGPYIRSESIDSVLIDKAVIVHHDGGDRKEKGWWISKYGNMFELEVFLGEMSAEGRARLVREFGIETHDYSNPYIEDHHPNFKKTPACRALRAWARKHPALAKDCKGIQMYLSKPRQRVVKKPNVVQLPAR